MCNRCYPNIREALIHYQSTGADLNDLQEVRKLLGPSLANLPDEEVAHIRNLLSAFADTAFDWWLEGRKERLKD